MFKPQQKNPSRFTHPRRFESWGFTVIWFLDVFFAGSSGAPNSVECLAPPTSDKMAGSNHKPCAPAMTTTRKSTCRKPAAFWCKPSWWILILDMLVDWMKRWNLCFLMTYRISFLKTSSPKKYIQMKFPKIWGEHENILIIWFEENPKPLRDFLELMHTRSSDQLQFVSLPTSWPIWSPPPSGTVFHQMGHLPQFSGWKWRTIDTCSKHLNIL